MNFRSFLQIKVNGVTLLSGYSNIQTQKDSK